MIQNARAFHHKRNSGGEIIALAIDLFTTKSHREHNLSKRYSQSSKTLIYEKGAGFFLFTFQILLCVLFEKLFYGKITQ